MKLIGSDYDGTMFVDKKYEDGLNEVIVECRKNHLFGIVTGRSLLTIEEQVRINSIPVDFIISNNGGLIKIKDQIIHKSIFKKDCINKFLAFINNEHILGYVLNSGLKRTKVTLSNDNRILNYGDPSQYMETGLFLQEESIAQAVLVLYNQEDGERIAHQINETFKGLVSAFVNIGCIDVVPYGVNKANGLEIVATYFSIELDHIYCIGDGGNDLPMLLRYNGSTLHHASDRMHDDIGSSYQDVQSFIKDVCHE